MGENISHFFVSIGLVTSVMLISVPKPRNVTKCQIFQNFPIGKTYTLHENPVFL